MYIHVHVYHVFTPMIRAEICAEHTGTCTLAVPSPLAETIHLPSGLNSMLLMASLCPL